MTRVLDAALDYANRFGWRVFPVLANKRPATEHGFLDAVEEPEQIRDLFRRNPAPMLGVATGESDIFVLDIDLDREKCIDGRPWWQEQERKHGALNTATAQTPRGGRHLYFRRPCLRDFPSSASKLAPGVDTRCDGGYVVVPPSRTTTGSYTWLVPPDTRLVDMPCWLIQLTAKPDVTPHRAVPRPLPTGSYNRLNRYLHVALERAVNDVATAPEHQRNVTLNAVAYGIGKLIPKGLPEEVAAGLLIGAALDIGLSHREARGTVHSGITKGIAHAR